MNAWAVLDGFGGEQVIALRPTAVRAFGASAGILLSQFLYWQKRAQGQGWFWNTQSELEQQTGLSVDAQQTARKVLVKYGCLEERRVGLPSRLEYRLNLERLIQLLTEHGEVQPRQQSENLRYSHRETSESSAPVTSESLYKEEETLEETLREEPKKPASKNRSPSRNQIKKPKATREDFPITGDPLSANLNAGIPATPGREDVPPASRPRDEFFDAIAEACYGGLNGLTKPVSSRIAAAKKTLTAGGYAAEDVPKIAVWIVENQQWRNGDFSPGVLIECAALWKNQKRAIPHNSRRDDLDTSNHPSRRKL
jgi:hypothetical protein